MCQEYSRILTVSHFFDLASEIVRTTKNDKFCGFNKQKIQSAEFDPPVNVILN